MTVLKNRSLRRWESIPADFGLLLIDTKSYPIR